MCTVESTVENESKLQKELKKKQKCRGAKVERRKYNSIAHMQREQKVQNLV